jgi:hypothetical protein
MIHPYHPYKDLLFKFEASISIQLQLNSYIPSYLLCLFTSYTWGPLVNFFFTTTPPLLLSPPARPPIPLPFPLFLTQGPTGPPPPAWLAGQSTAAPHGAASGVERCRWEPPARPHGHDLQGRAPPAPRARPLTQGAARTHRRGRGGPSPVAMRTDGASCRRSPCAIYKVQGTTLSPNPTLFSLVPCFPLSHTSLVARGNCDNPPRKISYYHLNQSTLVIKQY